MQQVLLSRPDLTSQVGPLPEVPPEGQGVVTVLANMAELANNLDTNGVDVNSFLAEQSPDTQLTSLLSAVNGRKLKVTISDWKNLYLSMHSGFAFQLAVIVIMVPQVLIAFAASFQDSGKLQDHLLDDDYLIS